MRFKLKLTIIVFLGHNDEPTLEIQSSAPVSHVGDTLDLHCRSTEPGVITTWSKVNEVFAPNIQSVGGTLRISSIRPENGGVYRCEARGYSGIYHKDYTVDILGKLYKTQ